MNEIITTTRTMSSQEIAELTGKRHDAVLRDIRNLLLQGVAAHNFVEGEYKDKNNQSRPCYNLTKKGCLILASGYDAKLRERIIDRWEALETGNATPAYQLPQSYADALRELAGKVEENERLMLENQKQASMIEEQAPKVVFADAIVGSRSSCLIGELAKILRQNGIEIGQNRLFQWMREQHYLGTKGEYYNVPLQQWVEQGLFELKQNVYSINGEIRTKTTTKVTGKGQQYFINIFLKEKNGNK